MKIISANWLITCDENSSIIENGAIVFDDKIIEIDSLENIEKKYSNIEILNFKKFSFNARSYKFSCSFRV